MNLPVFQVQQVNGVNVGAMAIAAAAVKSSNRLDLRDLPRAPQATQPAPR